MSTSASAREALLAAIPALRAFAFSLCNSRDRADDLVQETLLSAWAHLDRFHEGTNMGAWLFTILRNHFRSGWRKRRRLVEDVDGKHASHLTAPPAQDGWAAFADLRYALARLPAEQREAVILVGASGMSTQEAARICGCEEGTIKSRVSRGRARLAELMAGGPPHHHAPRRSHIAAMPTAA